MKKKDKKKLVSLIIALIIIFAYSYFNNSNEESYSKINNTNIVSTDLKVYFLDVGQADSILISNNNHHMLIDAGNNEDGQKLVSYIRDELGITKFDYVIGTHPHEDHIGGLDDIINSFEVDNIYLPDVITTTKTFEDVIDSIDKKNLSIDIPSIGDTFKLGEADFQVIYTGSDVSDLNNSSIVLKMVFGNYSYLFTGDATDKVEKEIINSDINVDILKVGHHGSAYSSSEEFLNKVSPDYAFISVAEKNSYNHPSPDTINRLKKHTNNIYMTSQLGKILLTSNGNEIEVSNFYTDTNG